MDNLKHKTLNGLFWSGIDSFGIYILTFGFSIAIARILSPEDYGLVGMMAIFIAVAAMFAESGFSMALIQKKDAGQKDFSTVFFFNIIVAVIFYIIFYITAPWIADFYNEPRLINIARVISLSLIIGSFSTIQLTILSKELNFKIQAKCNAIAAVSSGVIGLLMAWKGFGVWALIIQTLSGNLIRSVLYWIFNKWRPSLIFSFQSFKDLYNYGYKIFLQGLSDAIFRNIYFPIIGKTFSVGELGYYTRANRFYEIFVRRVTIAYGRVIFPAFAQIQDQNDRFLNVYLKTYRLLLYTLLPFTMILMITARPFVHFFLTEKWMPIVPFMILFFIEGLFFPLLMLNQNTFNAKGKSNISLIIDTLKKVLTLISIFIAFRYGISGLIVGQVVSSFIVFILSGLMIHNLLKVKLSKQLKEFVPIVLILLPCIIFCKFIVSKCIANDLIQIILHVVSFTLIYFMLSIIFKITAARELYSMLENYLPQQVKLFIFYVR